MRLRMCDFFCTFVAQRRRAYDCTSTDIRWTVKTLYYYGYKRIAKTDCYLV